MREGIAGSVNRQPGPQGQGQGVGRIAGHGQLGTRPLDVQGTAAPLPRHIVEDDTDNPGLEGGGETG